MKTHVYYIHVELPGNLLKQNPTPIQKWGNARKVQNRNTVFARSLYTRLRDARCSFEVKSLFVMRRLPMVRIECTAAVIVKIQDLPGITMIEPAQDAPAKSPRAFRRLLPPRPR